MASVSTLFLYSLIVLFGCHYVSAGKGGGWGKGGGRGQAAKFRELKFSQIISGQRWCRLQETLGWRLYQEKTYCDLGIIVEDKIDEFIESKYKEDNASRSQAIDSLHRREFCAHRSVLALRSAFFENLILQSLGGVSSYRLRHIYINVTEIPPDVIPYILQFIYTYQIDNFEPKRHIIDLYVGSYIMQLDMLRNSILNYILNEMEESIEQLHKIMQWMKWAQAQNKRDLFRDLYRMLRDILRLENNKRWFEFGEFICLITRSSFLRELNGQGDTRTAPRISNLK